MCYYCLSQQALTELVPLSLKLQKTSEKAVHIATVHTLGSATYFHLQGKKKNQKQPPQKKPITKRKLLKWNKIIFKEDMQNKHIKYKVLAGKTPLLKRDQKTALEKHILKWLILSITLNYLPSLWLYTNTCQWRPCLRTHLYTIITCIESSHQLLRRTGKPEQTSSLGSFRNSNASLLTRKQDLLTC